MSHFSGSLRKEVPFCRNLSLIASVLSITSSLWKFQDRWNILIDDWWSGASKDLPSGENTGQRIKPLFSCLAINLLYLVIRFQWWASLYPFEGFPRNSTHPSQQLHWRQITSLLKYIQICHKIVQRDLNHIPPHQPMPVSWPLTIFFHLQF